MKRRHIISYRNICQILRRYFLPAFVGLLLCFGFVKAVDYAGTTTIPTSMYYLPTTTLADGDTATGFVLFSDGFTIGGPAVTGVTLNVPLPVMGRVRLDTGSLLNLNADLNWGSNVSLIIGAGGGDSASIDGKGKTIFLGSNLGFPQDRRLAIGTGDLTIDGQGYTFSLSTLSAFYIASGSKLILRNMVIDGFTGGAQIDGRGTLQLEDVIINLPTSTTWSFSGINANLIVANDVIVRGGGTFEFGGDGNVTLNSHSMLTIDNEVIFSYAPQDLGRNHVIFTDNTSCLFLNGGTLQAIGDGSQNGVQLTIGTLFMDNHVTLDNGTNANAAKSIEFGNGTNDLSVKVLSGAYTLINGYVYHNPA